MSRARHALIEAVYATLVADAELDGVLAGGKVFDHVPRAAEYPFVSFGDFETGATDGDAVPSELHRFDVLVHSRAPGRAEASAIADRVAALMDGAALVLTGASLVYLRLRDTEVGASRGRTAYRVRMRFEALTEII